jgi:hypothetical protein
MAHTPMQQRNGALSARHRARTPHSRYQAAQVQGSHVSKAFRMTPSMPSFHSPGEHRAVARRTYRRALAEKVDCTGTSKNLSEHAGV